jgi:hypothetical protein
MRVRPFVLCVVLVGAALGAAGCSSSGPSSPGAPSSSAASSSGAGASSNGAGASSSGKAPVGKPGGTVTVRSGGKVVCVITLDKNGTGTCKVSTAGYAPGKVTYTGTYNGSTGFKAGSATTTLTVLPAKPAGPVASSAAPGAS